MDLPPAHIDKHEMQNRRLIVDGLTNVGSAWIVKMYSLRLFFNLVCNYMYRPTSLKPKVTSLTFISLSRLHLMDLFRALRSNTFNTTMSFAGRVTKPVDFVVVAFFPHLHKINREICKGKRRQPYIVSCDILWESQIIYRNTVSRSIIDLRCRNSWIWIIVKG